MTSVRQLLRTKPQGAITIAPKATIELALRLLAEKDIGALVVIEGEQVMGIFSERDYARKVFLTARSEEKTRVEEVMTRKVYYAHPDQSINDVMTLMTTKHIRHLPVIENEKLLGVISIGDVVKTVIADHEFTIREMEKYITGSLG